MSSGTKSVLSTQRSSNSTGSSPYRLLINHSFSKFGLKTTITAVFGRSCQILRIVWLRLWRFSGWFSLMCLRIWGVFLFVRAAISIGLRCRLCGKISSSSWSAVLKMELTWTQKISSEYADSYMEKCSLIQSLIQKTSSSWIS